MYEVNYLDILNQGGQGAAMGGSVGGGWGAAIGAGMGLISGASNQYAGQINANNQIEQQGKLNEMQIKGNKDLMNEQARLQYEMWLKTNYKEQIAQMKEAGLNPALIYKSAGGGGVTGNISSSGVSGGNASNESERLNARSQAMGLQLSSMRAIAEIENIKADTKNKEVLATKTAGVDTELAKANIELVGASTVNTKVETEGRILDNIGKDIDNIVKSGKADLEYELLKNKVIEARLLIKKIEAELPYVGKQAEANLNSTLAGTKLSQATTKLREEESDFKKFENTEEQRDLRTGQKRLDYQLSEEELKIKMKYRENFEQFGIPPNGSVAGTITGIIAKVSRDGGIITEELVNKLIKALK